jgi:hypothetical protein
MNCVPNQVTSLDAAMTVFFHTVRQWRGASEFFRSAMRKILVLLVSALAVSFARAQGTVNSLNSVYQQLPGHFGGYDSDSNIAVADNFELGQSMVIGGLTWWGGVYNPSPTPNYFTVRLYSDSGSKPGSLIDQFDLRQIGKTATGQYVNAPGLYPEYEYTASLPAPFQVQPGVTYWLSIVYSPANVWVWEASGSSVNDGVERSFGGGAWQPYYGNAAFQIVAIPEPATGIIVALFVWGTLFSKRRKGGGTRCAERDHCTVCRESVMSACSTPLRGPGELFR